MSGEVTAAFRKALGPTVRCALSEERLARLLAELDASAREAHPRLDVPATAFATHLASRLGSDADVERDLESLQVSDLFLACACLRGDAVALAEFDREVLGGLGPTLARLCRSGGADEVKQVLRQRLLLGEDGGRARIGDYSGRGPLRHWVAAAAARVALNLRRGRGAEASEGDEALAELPAGEDDAELACIKAAHRREFVAAFQASLQSLTGRERTLLRLSFLDGLSIDEIGAMYRVHRSTVARWIARCREELLSETRRRLQEKLQLSPSELRSLMRVVDSHIDVSISRFLGA